MRADCYTRDHGADMIVNLLLNAMRVVMVCSGCAMMPLSAIWSREFD